MIYLDYNATAPVKPDVQQAMQQAMTLTGNPSSIHLYGRNTRKVIEQARQDLATLIGCDPTFITFTSGATEANNTVLQQVKAERVLVSAIEHPSVMDVAAILKEQKGVNLIPVNKDGVIDLEALERLLVNDRRSTLVSVMLANNETGVIQPIEEIVRLAKTHGALVHVDGVQALGKIDIAWDDLGVDFLVLSAHKMGGPAGVGAMVYDHDQAILKHVYGGGQERRRRAGTENIIGIAGFGAAARIALADRDHLSQLRQWHQAMEREIQKTLPQGVIFGEDATRIGNVTQVALPDVPAEKQLIALDLAGFAVSSGAACSSGSIKPSHVLQAMDVPNDLAKCAIRISSGWATTEEDIKTFTQAYLAMAQRLKPEQVV